jgi:hypothetical protein
MFFFQQIHVSLQFSSIGLFSLKWMWSHLKTLGDRFYSFDMHIQFKKGSMLLDTAACNLDADLPADTCISSIQQYKPIFTKVNVSATWKCWHLRSITLRFTLCSRRELCVVHASFQLTFYSSNSYVCLFSSQYRLIFQRENVCPTWKCFLIGVFLWHANSFLKAEHCVANSSFYIRYFSSSRYMCLLNSAV